MKPPSVLTSVICRLAEAGFEGSKVTVMIPVLWIVTYSIQGSVSTLGDNEEAYTDVAKKIMNSVKARDLIMALMTGMRCYLRSK
jgi:hypothetical protein